MSSTPEVSIITLTYLNNWSVYTEDFVKQVLSMTDGVDFEVIVVDNGTKPPVEKCASSIVKNDSRVKIVTPKSNLGFSGGNNFGARFASGKNLLFVNDDVVIHNPDWLKKLLRAKNDGTFVGAQLISGNSLTEYRLSDVDYLGGWCVLMTRHEYNAVGGWDTDFGKGFFEDVWMSVKMVNAGKKLVGVDCGLEHLGSKTVSKVGPSELTKFAKTVYLSKMSMSESKPSVAFYYNGYSFSDSDYEGRGVGGAEGALIQLAREMVLNNWHVEVFNGGNMSGYFNGVLYKNISEFNPLEYRDVFVLWRDFYPNLDAIFAKTKIFFSCDQQTSGDWNTDIFPHVDGVVAISQFHRDYMASHYNITKDDITVMDLGIKKSDYAKILPKIKGKMIYCSVPGRGLKYLPYAYAEIKKKVPYASLYITSDYTLWGSQDPLNKEYIDMFLSLPDVHFLGKVSREELVFHQLTSEIMAYPCDYEENFCISAMECIAAGAVPVTFNIGAMGTTVGDSGIVINTKVSSNPETAIQTFILSICNLLQDENTRNSMEERGKFRAMNSYSWDYLGKNYSDLFKKIMKDCEDLDMQTCEICEETFTCAFDMFKHRSEKHITKYIMPNSLSKDIIVTVSTRRKVELSINNMSWNGKELKMPKESLSDVIRILKEAYGDDIVLAIGQLSS